MRNETPESRAKRLANLKPAKKGEVRNPTGRGAGPNLWRWASKIGAPEKLVEPMRVLFNFPKGKITVETAISLRRALEACRGDMKAMEMWIDRKYGKVTQPLDVQATNGPLVAILNAPRPPPMKTVQEEKTDAITDVPDDAPPL